MPTRQETNLPKPLNELQLHLVGDDGVRLLVPAIDKRWTTRTVFATYVSLIRCDGQLKSDVELEEWQHEAEIFHQDIQYLLQRQHHVFWSYMVHQKAAIAAIVSFLQHATPFYLDLTTTTETQQQISLYEQILSKVLRLICRLITNKESPDAWLRKEHMSELIYSNYLITVPMLFDLVIAIGDASPQNASILRRIFLTVFELEPKYKDDLLAALAFFRAAFRSIQTQAENEGFEGAGGGTLDDSTETPYDDVALYTLDCAFSLSVLMEVCPLVRTLSAQINLGKSIASFYDTTIPNLYKNIYQINETATSLSWINQARLQFLTTFRKIAFSFVEAVLLKPEESLLSVESFLALMTDCLSEQTFVVDYERQYPIAFDMDILKQACPNLDEFKAAFVLQGYQQEAEQQAGRTYDNIENLTQNFNQFSVNPTPTVSSVCTTNGIKDSPKKKSTKAVERDIDLEVTAVLDMLPHLGTGFVRRVLSRYENSDQAVAAILEENLPPDLVNADRNEPYIPPDVQDKVYLETGVKHFNVYDGDAYDIMTQDKPACVIKRGKGLPNAPKNAAQLLDDKSDLDKVRHRYQAYTLVTEDHDENDTNAEYDDEYDDSYEALLESETRVVRSKDLKAKLADVDDISEDEGDDEDETASGEENAQGADNKAQNKRMNFCENPEVIRARYEAKRQAKWSAQRGSPASSNQSKHDVVGAPKGQGQDKETLRNRQKKEANKSSRANHNRKTGAAFKRSRGMMP